MPEYRDHPQPVRPMTPERKALIRVLQDAVWPFLAHDPANPDVFWCQMARKIEEHYAAEVDRLRARVAEVEQQRDLAFRDGTIEAAEAILQVDFIGGSSYTLEKRVRERLAEYRETRAALASGDEVQHG